MERGTWRTQVEGGILHKPKAINESTKFKLAFGIIFGEARCIIVPVGIELLCVIGTLLIRSYLIKYYYYYPTTVVIISDNGLLFWWGGIGAGCKHLQRAAWVSLSITPNDPAPFVHPHFCAPRQTILYFLNKWRLEGGIKFGAIESPMSIPSIIWWHKCIVTANSSSSKYPSLSISDRFHTLPNVS